MHAMPFIIINLGGEMIFILEQRLRSQQVAADKGQKVLQDIVKTMLSKKFMEEVFKPQPMYSLVETRQIFVKLAHSSLMSLNESSMSKLFDLMLMGIKQQMIQTCYPEEMLHITIKHLDQLAEMVQTGTEAHQLIQEAKASFIFLVNQFNSYEFSVLKGQVSKFYQDKHTKVSLFISDETQDIDGCVHLNISGKNVIYTPLGNKPGTVKFFVPGGKDGEIANKKSIQMIHTVQCYDNKFETRTVGTT